MHGKLFDGAKNVRDWLDRLGARDGVKRGMRLDGAANGHESHAAPRLFHGDKPRSRADKFP